MRRLFGCPDIVSLTEKFLMARNFYRIFTENNPVMGGQQNLWYSRSEGVKCSKYTYRSKWVNRFWLVKALSGIVQDGQNDSKNQSKKPLCAHLGQRSKQAVDWFWPLQLLATKVPSIVGGLKRGSKVKFSFVLHSFSNRQSPYENRKNITSLSPHIKAV